MLNGRYAYLINNFNSFKPNEMHHSYLLDQYTSILRVVGWYFVFFIFYLNLNMTFCKQTVETLIIETVPLGTHSICFGWEMRKLFFLLHNL